ncbi:DUF4150 domain-containing protein [Sorangium cellulosum]|uniref:Type VI secretion protein n=2 Tax=Sorangium cellulosum TaxID=56 RepID=A0A150TMB4_SORCE|nr:DUF4150 domain-containing protein [Sorangium cellulosum]AGP35579.1 hypothetical protein SCE1572_14200 [Sorangium cellulosum So0157-2]KYG05841.1 type VI secretion protein [Sorangium cellulosum]
MFANSQMGGMALGGPDVCLTPPAHLPVPYPNLAAQPMGVPAVYNVLLTCAPAHNMMTQVPLTNGDNAGLETGVVSHTVMGPSRHVTAAFTVLIGGAPVTRMTSITMQNSVNAPGLSIVPSQVKVLVLAP